MSLNWKAGIFLFLLALVFITTPYFGRVETRRFSAYAACRKVAMATKGYAVWEHKQTTEKMFRSRIIFSDGFSKIECRAIGVGPFWIVRVFLHNWVICDQDPNNGKIMECQEEYYGVNP